MSTGKNTGRTGKNVGSGGGGAFNPDALENIRIVAGELIVTKADGSETNLGKTVVQELFTETITVPAGSDQQVEVTHNLGTKNVIFQLFDAQDEAVDVASIRYENKIKFFFGTTDSEETFTVVIAH